MNERIHALLVMNPDQLGDIAVSDAARSLDVTTASNCAEAREAMSCMAPVDVVVADLTLDDGNWWSVYQDLAKRDVCAELIVVAPRRGLDVSEILSHGVYAVLGRPLEGEEVVRAIEEAAAHKANGKGPRVRQHAPAGA